MAEDKQFVSSQPEVCSLMNRNSEPHVLISCHVMCALQGTAPMKVGGNKNANNVPVGPDGKRDWSFGLFDCFSRCQLCTFWNRSAKFGPPTFRDTDRLPLSTAGCHSTCCPCVVYSKNRQRLRHLQQHGTPHPTGGESNDDHCFIYGALAITGYAWILHVRAMFDKMLPNSLPPGRRRRSD